MLLFIFVEMESQRYGPEVVSREKRTLGGKFRRRVVKEGIRKCCWGVLSYDRLW